MIVICSGFTVCAYTLCLLLGTILLDHVFKICKEDGKFDSIYLYGFAHNLQHYVFIVLFHLSVCFCRHVQVSNEEALSFYKRFGFKIKEKEEKYYKRIEPTDAYVLEKDAQDLLHSS